MVKEIETEREIIAMQLYKYAYMANIHDIRAYTGNIAETRAKEAVAAFRESFPVEVMK